MENGLGWFRRSWFTSGAGWPLHGSFCSPSPSNTCKLPISSLSNTHPFVHQHVYSWHESHCGTSRGCWRKSGRASWIFSLTARQRQTHTHSRIKIPKFNRGATPGMVTWSEHSRHSAWCVCLHCTHKSPHPGEDGRPGHRLTVFSVTDPQTRVNLKRRGRWNTDTHRETVSDLIDSYEKNPPQPVAVIAATLRAMTSCLRTCSHVACLVGEEIDFFFFFFWLPCCCTSCT